MGCLKSSPSNAHPDSLSAPGLVGTAIFDRPFSPQPAGMRLKRNLIGLIQFSPLAAATIISQTTTSGPLSVLIVIAALALTTILIWLLRHHVPASPIHHTPKKS